MNSKVRKLDLLDRQLYYSIKGEHEKSDEILDKLLIERPNNSRVLYNTAFKQLRKGEIKEGMENLNTGRNIGIFGSPPLTLERLLTPSKSNVKDSIILINLEGGIGDNLLGLKFARELFLAGNKIIIVGPKGIKRIIENQPYIHKYYENFDNNIEFDFWMPSLAAEFILSYQNYSKIPKEPHIFVEENIEPINNSIGVRFRGNPEFDHNRYRSPKPEEIVKCLEPFKDDFNFYSLEVDKGLTLPDWIKTPDRFKDWYDTALFIKKMDMVISTCTGVAHLSAGLGKKTFIMIPVLPYWVWAYPNMIDGHDRSWYYENVYLFRQEKFGEWKALLSRIEEELNTIK
jgi:hypothetical protein